MHLLIIILLVLHFTGHDKDEGNIPPDHVIPVYLQDQHVHRKIYRQMKPRGAVHNGKKKTMFNIFLPHGAEQWHVRREEQVFRGCPIDSCKLRFHRQAAVTADVILFRDSILRVAKQRPLDQIWIFFTLESPVNLDFHLHEHAYAINYTATYRSDSDIPAPYGLFVPYSGGNFSKTNKTASIAQTSHFQFKFPLKSEFTTATPTAFAIISNCKCTSRLKFIYELQKFMTVHVFGACGRPCSTESCDEEWKTGYDFYLAFENSNCREYVTEKAFNALR